MHSRPIKLVLAGLALFAPAAIAFAAPTVSFEYTYVGSLDYYAIDFFYSASPGAEFTNFRLNVVSTNGAKILDPITFQTWDAHGDVVDTFMNSVYSLFDLGPPNVGFNSYKPIGIPPNDTPPVSRIDWSVIDSGSNTGDSNSFDAGPPYGVVSAPWHLARVLVKWDFLGVMEFRALDTQSGGVPTTFYFIPYLTRPPAASRTTVTALPGDILGHTFVAVDLDEPGLTGFDWSDFTFAGPGIAVQPTFDYQTQQFNWDSTGSAPGLYKAAVNVGVTSTATLTIHLIPEPSCLALAGLALAALVAGSRRRRSAPPIN